MSLITYTGEQQVHYWTPRDGAIYYLAQEVIVGTFQEPTELLIALHAIFPEDASCLGFTPPAATAPERQ